MFSFVFSASCGTSQTSFLTLQTTYLFLSLNFRDISREIIIDLLLFRITNISFTPDDFLGRL